jgi:protein-S-isoprenylcysteine O-methyltransferase Ste14
MTGASAPLAAIVAGGVFAAFIWALRGHFVSAAVPIRMWLVSAVSACAFVAFIAGLAATAPSELRFGTGAVTHLAALALFLAAVRSTRQRRVTLAFDRDMPEFLVKAGVYRRVRHPFYSSYLLFWAGCCIQCPTFPMITCAVALAALYGWAALTEERKFAVSRLAREYQAYRRDTGLFWPKLPGWRSEP